jgi:SAM-dependent methyltransferase
MSTDFAWERWGASDPYYGVLTNPKFRASVLTAEAKEEFFATGRCHVQYIYDQCRRYFGPDFAPGRVMDFGCGVGRLLVYFAERAPSVVGVDVSRSMLEEARRNCEQRGAPNVEFVISDDELTDAPGPYDLVHSSIVLQHIEVARGRLIFEKLVARVAPGGVGALHLTFGWDLYASTMGQPPPREPPPPAPPTFWQRLVGRPAPEPPPPPPVSADPEMQMNYYNLSEMFFCLQRAGIREVHAGLTDHGGALGSFLFFKKPAG